MKKNHNILLITLIFYIAAGLLTCIFFFKNSSDLEQNDKAALVYSNVVGKPITDENEAAEITIKSTPEALSKEAFEKETFEKESFEPKSPADDEKPESLSDAQEVKYYSFITTNEVLPLRIRTGPGLDETIIGKLSPASKGYVIEYGDEWCLIATSRKIGYSSNEYLKLTEIPKEEYPEEYIGIADKAKSELKNK